MSKKPIIVFEGIEGTGKSHHIDNVAKYLKRNSIKYIKIREPGGSKNSEKIRQLILSKKSTFNKNTDLLLYLSARSENVDVWLGKKETVNVYVKDDIYKTIPKARKKHLKVYLTYKGPIPAPIKKNDILGKLMVTYKDELIEEYDLFAFEDVKKLNVLSRLMKSINFLIWGDV